MLQELLFRVYTKFRHITILSLILLCTEFAYSQSVLLPGDIAIVSTNSTNHSFDFIPLVDIQKGTSVWFTNGKWDSEEFSLSEGEEIEITFLNAVSAGTNIHINSISDPRIKLNGHLIFRKEENRIFAYQKDEDVYRFIYGLGWGSDDVWSAYLKEGADIPKSLSLENKTILRLGTYDNYQYHLKNGASGTSNMLLSFISDPSKWVGRDKLAYSSFGTTFRLLAPPVVLFDESISTVTEGEAIVLNVAIYEHDGSRLTVEANFNEFSSTADTNDIEKLNAYSFNFTGLIGNAVYSKEIPVKDDEIFETSENGFFELTNLSKGSLGDFITHVAFIQDNDIPAIRLTDVLNSGSSSDNFIALRNSERQVVNLSGWVLSGKTMRYEFPEGTLVSPLSQLIILQTEISESSDSGLAWIDQDDKKIELRNAKGMIISEFELSKGKKSETISQADENPNLTFESTGAKINTVQASPNPEKKKAGPIIKDAGWYSVSLDELSAQIDTDNPALFWLEPLSKFVSTEEYGAPNSSGVNIIAYFEEEIIIPKSPADSVSTLEIEDQDDILEFEISATDFDENGVIDGAEGFNYIKNTTAKSISVRDFLRLIEEQTSSGAMYPYVYQANDGLLDWSKAVVLKEFDIILPNSTFWVKADSSLESVLISFQVPEFLESDLELEVDEAISTLSISLESNGIGKKIDINLFEEDQELGRDLIAPELEPNLLINTSEYFFFGARSGMNWSRELSFYINEEQKRVIPLAFTSSFSDEFIIKVNGMERMPLGWKFHLKDLFSDKDYDLSNTGPIIFDHKVNEVENESIIPGQSTSKDIVKDRFLLVLYPPGVSEEEETVTDQLRLNQNYPNPFNPRTTISFYLPSAVEVKLSIFNIVGQPILVLEDGMLGAGDHDYEWDASGLPSGMYIYQLEVGNKITTQKMTLVK